MTRQELNALQPEYRRINVEVKASLEYCCRVMAELQTALAIIGNDEQIISYEEWSTVTASVLKAWEETEHPVVHEIWQNLLTRSRVDIIRAIERSDITSIEEWRGQNEAHTWLADLVKKIDKIPLTREQQVDISLELMDAVERYYKKEKELSGVKLERLNCYFLAAIARFRFAEDCQAVQLWIERILNRLNH